MARSLDDLVTAAAAELMAANAVSHVAASERVLAELVGRLGVDFGFLRHNDHTIHATVLVAEWPARQNIPDPDPIAVVYFADADSVFARAETMKAPDVLRPDSANADYQRNIEEGSAVPAVSLACAPLLSGDVTTGILGFVKFGDRDWLAEELNALQTVATLFAQLQARIAAEEHVRYLADHDDLTGLLNRRALIAHLDDRLAAGQPGPVAVLHLDLDRFKVINDHLGQNAGDQFITAVADNLREALDQPAAIARFLGDAFAVVPGAPMSIEAAQAFALRLQESASRGVVIGGEVLGRTVSIGVAIGRPGVDSTSNLLRHVDQAARSAKGAGGNRVSAFTVEMSRNEMIRNEIQFLLDGSSDDRRGELTLRYLPEFDLRTGEVLGAEALVRWQHPTRGLLMPESFIGVIESVNLAPKLGRYVVRSAVAQIARWRSGGLGNDAVLRVNASPAQLVAGGIVERFASTLDEFGVAANALCVEITENVMVQDTNATSRILAGLKDVGVQIAIDDFGTGYNVLEHLKWLPVDTLKIDREFVRDLGSDPRDLAIVRSILSLADAFGLDVVAEGVETAAGVEALLELGCFRAQGFLLSEPLDAAAMEALLSRRFVPMDFADERGCPGASPPPLQHPGSARR